MREKLKEIKGIELNSRKKYITRMVVKKLNVKRNIMKLKNKHGEKLWEKCTDLRDEIIKER